MRCLKTIVPALVWLAGILPVALFASPSLVYYSTLDSTTAVTQPVVGPAGQWISPQPTFLAAYMAQGMRAAGTGVDATGGYQFTATGMIGSEGCVEFYLKLLDNYVAGSFMPVLFSSQDLQFTGQLDLRPGTQRIVCTFGSAQLNAETAWWAPGQFHHAALSWSASQGWVRLYIDNVLMDSKQITQAPSVTGIAVNCRLDIPGHQANNCTAIDNFKIWDGVKTDFSADVPSDWTEKVLARTEPQMLQSKTDDGLGGVAWTVDSPATPYVNITPVGRNAVALKFNYQSNTWVTLRPSTRIPLRSTDKWLIFYAHQFSLGNIEVYALVKGQDGVERSFIVSVGAGQGWRQCLSAYIGGIRSDLVSMRPGDTQSPRGDSPPAELTGIKIRPTLYGNGICYIRDLRATDHDFLTEPKWRVWTYRGNMNLVGGLESDPCSPSQAKIGLPFVFAEDLLSASDEQARLSTVKPLVTDIPSLALGDYQVQLEVTNRYQGAPSSRQVIKLNYDPGDIADTYTTRFNLPQKDGTYWLDAKVRKSTGEWVAGWRSNYSADGVGASLSQAPERTLPAEKPGIGLLALATGQPDHIFDSPAIPIVQVRAWKADGWTAPYKLHYKIEEVWSIRFKIPVADSNIDLTFPSAYTDRSISITGATRTTAYVVTVELINGSTIVDREQIIVGARFPEPTLSPAAGLATLTSLVQSGPLFSSASDCWLIQTDKTSYLNELKWTSATSQNMTGLATIQRLELPWWTFEVLPGLYCFGSIDDKVAAMKQTNASIQISLSSSLGAEPDWMPREAIASQYGCWNWGSNFDGTAFPWEFASYFTASTMSASRSNQSAAWDKLSNHYLQETAVKAYMTHSDDSFWDNNNLITDYSEYARQGFISYLQNTLSLSLAQVNSRYGTSWTSWSQAQLPQSKPVEPDLTDAWRDFTSFKQATMRHGIFDICVDRLRAKGDTRPVFFYHENYGGSIEEYWPDAATKGVVICAGWGEDYTSDYGSHVAGYLQGSSYSSEPHPASIWPDPKRVDNIFAGALSAGGAGFIFHHYWTRETQAPHQASLTRMAQWAAAIRGLGRAEPQLMDIGFYHGAGSGLAGKSFGSYISLGGWGGIESWYKDHCLPTYISTYTGHDRIDQMKLLVAAHYLLTENDVTLIKNYVMGGGKLFLPGPFMGSYCWERPTENYVLYRELGWTDTSVFNEDTTGSCTANLDPSFFTHVSSLSLYSTTPTTNYSLPAGATVLGTFTNGKPAVVRWSLGAGEVIACVRQIPWMMTGGTNTYQTDLRAWAGVPDRLGLASPNNEILLNEFMNGSTRYLLVTRRSSSSTDPITVQAQIKDLPSGSYAVTELGPRAGTIGTLTAEQFSAGMSVDLTERELRLFKIIPQ